MRPTNVLNFRRTVLEVERKFCCDSKTTELIHNNAGNPPFRSLKPLGQRSFEDIYVDRIEILCREGIWLRQRNGTWQANVRQNNTWKTKKSESVDIRANTQFEEITTKKDILRTICSTFSDKDSKDIDLTSNTFGLEQMARFTTFREMWKVDEKFEMVLDTADFGHSVGEVELQETIEVDDGDGDAVSTMRKQRRSMEMDSQIEAFMKRYPWAFFPSEKPMGKLSAYFDIRKKS